MAGGMVAALTYIKDRTEENAASQKAFAANYEVKHAKAMQEVEGLRRPSRRTVRGTLAREDTLLFNIVAAVQALLRVPQTIADVSALAKTLHDSLSVDQIKQQLENSPGVTAVVNQIVTALDKVATDASNLRKASFWNIASRFNNFVTDANALFDDVQAVNPEQLLSELAAAPEVEALINQVVTEWDRIKSDMQGIVSAL